MLIRSLVTALAVCASSACSSGEASDSALELRPPNPPPATSGLDHTVTIRWQLADSFDVFPDGRCTGRGTNAQMGAGARVRLRGTSTGMVDETRATARLEDHSRGRPAETDDGRYCVVVGVFAPALPDPDGYRLSFPDSPQAEVTIGLDRVLGPVFAGAEPIRPPELPPGYGTFTIVTQTCPSTADPPDMECPVLAAS